MKPAGAPTRGELEPAMHPWRSGAAVSLIGPGDRGGAVELAEAEIGLARRWGTQRALGVALRAAGVAHGGEHGISVLQDAVNVLRDSAAPLEYARALINPGALFVVQASVPPPASTCAAASTARTASVETSWRRAPGTS